ncbi:MAG: hypothetical protein IPK79_00735 [Vampirovibrionales bacterium]|nr:hypothetical protein [Vampirovibrionales bacterium]
MSAGNPTFHERNLVGYIAPQLVDAGSVNSGWLAIGDAQRVVALIAVGATDTTVDAKLQAATDSSGTGAADITDAAITQVGATGDNRFATIDLDTSKLAATSNTHVRLLVTAGDGTSGAYVAAFVLRSTRHAPPTQPAAYAEQVVVAG